MMNVELLCRKVINKPLSSSSLLLLLLLLLLLNGGNVLLTGAFIATGDLVEELVLFCIDNTTTIMFNGFLLLNLFKIAWI